MRGNIVSCEFGSKEIYLSHKRDYADDLFPKYYWKRRCTHTVHEDFIWYLHDLLEPFICGRYRKKENVPDKRFFLLRTTYRYIRRSEDACLEAKLALKILNYEIGRANEKEGISNPRNKKYN